MSEPQPISVVMPTLNSADFVREGLESVLRQNYPNLELLVIDGGSTDGTAEIIEEYRSEIAFWTSEPDDGQADAINKGLRRSRGAFVSWLNADDFFYPGALQAVAQNNDADWIVGRTVLTDRQGRRLRAAPRNLPSGLTERSPDLWLGLACARQTGASIGPAVFWSRRALERAGLLDVSLNYVMDADYWIRLARSGFVPRFLDNEMVAARRHPAQKTAIGHAVPWCLEVIRLNAKLRGNTADPAARRRLARYQRWTIMHRLPHAVAAQARHRLSVLPISPARARAHASLDVLGSRHQ
jgi:glycosyltransferase involved in cell wall biosynthesis